MRTAIVVALLSFAWAGPAAALDCPEWKRMTPEQKTARIERKTESHLKSNVSKRFTSEDPVAMRSCMYEFTPEIVARYDHLCEQGQSTANALDDLFDKYFLSCVQ